MAQRTAARAGATARRGRHRIDNIDIPDLDTFAAALNRAIERHNVARFTPIGHERELAAVILRLTAEAIADGNTKLAATVLDQAQPQSPDGSAATVSGCIGTAWALLDQWLSGHDPRAPVGLAKLTRVAAGHWTGERAAADIFTLARKGRAFASLDALITQQGGQQVLHGSAPPSPPPFGHGHDTPTPVQDLARTAVR